jgi:hypothetical protein
MFEHSKPRIARTLAKLAIRHAQPLPPSRWTGIVARLMHLFATTTPEQVLELGKLATTVDVDAVAN